MSDGQQASARRAGEDEEEARITYDNPMQEPRLEKVVVSIGVGEGGEQLIKAEKVLEMVTGCQPVRTLAKRSNREFGIREGMPIGCKVTIRDAEVARDLLKDALWVRNNEIWEESFDDNGNISFGLPDYTDLPGHKYDPEIGVVGMNLNVTIARPGARVKRRRRRPARIPDKHRVSREESMQWLEDTFDAEVI